MKPNITPIALSFVLVIASLAPSLPRSAAAQGGAGMQDSVAAGFDGAWRYRVSCATCHGDEGEGISAYGPPLRGDAFVRNSPASLIITVIQEGRYNRNKAYPRYSGMPAFYYIRAGEAQALVSYMKGALQGGGG